MRIISTLLTLWLCFAHTAPTHAQENPIQAAKAAGLYGVEPDLTRSFNTPDASEGQQIAWDRYGIYFDEFQLLSYVSALKPGGAAIQQGAKIGDVVRFKTVTDIYRGFHSGIKQGDGSIQMYFYDGDDGYEKVYTLTPTAQDGTVVSIPPSLRRVATDKPGFMAILRGDPSGAEPFDITRDAMLALQAISLHVKGCAGPDAVSIPVKITQTTTTTNGFGTVTNRESDTFGEMLHVRPEFAAWTRANLGAYPVAALSDVRNSVLELISQQGCTGAGFKQLEAGLAEIMRVALPESAPPDSQGDSVADAGIPPDAAAFIAECYPLQQQAMAAKGYNMGERGLAQVCLCQEYAARASGDAKLYSSLQVVDPSYYDANPQLHDAFAESFDQCFRAPDGSELRLRVEALWRKMNI